MKRRGFLALLGGATLLRPVSAHPQQPPRVYRIAGVLPSYSPYFLNEASNPQNWRPFSDELRREGSRKVGT